MGGVSSAYDTPREEMIPEVVTPVAQNILQERLPGLDPVVYDAFDTLQRAMGSDTRIYETFVAMFSESMIEAQNKYSQFEGPLTVAKMAAKDFFDKWVKKV